MRRRTNPSRSRSTADKKLLKIRELISLILYVDHDNRFDYYVDMARGEVRELMLSDIDEEWHEEADDLENSLQWLISEKLIPSYETSMKQINEDKSEWKVW